MDREKNKHGEVLIGFLLVSKMCVLNARISPEFDDYTSKGRCGLFYHTS